MTILRIYTALFFIGLAIYTAIVIANHGIDFLTPFIDIVGTVTWPGQFTLDFAGYWILSALWVLWRHAFSPKGWLMAGLALSGGMLFFAPYLIYLIGRVEGDPKKLLLGVHAEPARG